MLAWMAYSEGRTLSPLHAADDASPCSDGGRRARTQAFHPHMLQGQGPHRTAGHLHTAMRRTQEHRISVVSACTKLYILLVSATDRQRRGWADPTDRSLQQPQQRWRDPLQWSGEHSPRAPCGCRQRAVWVLLATWRRRKADRCGNLGTLVPGGLTQQTRSLYLDNQLQYDDYKSRFKHVCAK